MSGSEISERVKYSISIEMEVPSYESTRHLPDSLVVRLDKKKEYTEGEVIQKRSEEIVRIGDNVLIDNFGSDQKLRLFIDIYRALAGDDRYDVKKDNLIDELVNTGKFTEQEALVYIKKAQQYGLIFERKEGLYTIA